MSTFHGKVALITGASRGIGAATAKLLGARGAKVVVNYLQNAPAAQDVVHEIRGTGGDAVAIQGSAAEADDCERMVAETLKAFGRLDILVVNAGADFEWNSFLGMSWETFARDVEAELKMSFLITKAAVPTMIQQSYGRIVFVASGTARNQGMGMISHGAAKAAQVTMAQYIAAELGPKGITVNIVAPGLTETDATAGANPELKARISALAPLRRVARPDDLAGAIAFFASDDAKFMTGVYAPVNGGTSMN